MKIGEVAGRCGLSIDTIRYYERAGLCPAIARGADGQRHFTPENLDWLTLLASLRDTGMPTREMKRFAALYRAGDESVAERKETLLAHGTALEAQAARLARCKALLAHKIARYDSILSGERP